MEPYSTVFVYQDRVRGKVFSKEFSYGCGCFPDREMFERFRDSDKENLCILWSREIPAAYQIDVIVECTRASGFPSEMEHLDERVRVILGELQEKETAEFPVIS